MVGENKFFDTLGDAQKTKLPGGAEVEGELDLKGSVSRNDFFEIFDDFVYQTIAETDTPWVLNSDSNDFSVTADAERGVLSGSTAASGDDRSQVVCDVPVHADSGGLFMEARLHIATAITEAIVNVGFTDIVTIETPVEISGTTYTTTASDAAVFAYDVNATTDKWHIVAVDGDTDDTGNTVTDTAPVADTYQTLRIEVSSDGATITFYINGTQVGQLSGAAGVSPDVDLYATVIVEATASTAKTVNIDYIHVGHNR